MAPQSQLVLHPLDHYTFLPTAEALVEGADGNNNDNDKNKNDDGGGGGESAKREVKKRNRTAEEEESMLRERYASEGQQRHATALLLVHRHGYPHVLLRKDGEAWRMVGGRLRAGESDDEGLRRILDKKVAATQADSLRPVNWQIGELAAQWWRPDFSPCVYPYVPAHIANAKESIKMFVVQLPAKCVLRMKPRSPIHAVPLFEIYDNAENFGPIISSIPHLLSRYAITCREGDNNGAADAAET